MLFYHYCAVDKFESILSSKSLWLTQIVKSNDKEEVIRTYKILWPKIRERLSKIVNDEERLSIILENLDSQLEFETHLIDNGIKTPYGICLSINRDLSQNWNEYGANGEGICLGFSTDLFRGIDRILPHPNERFQSSIGWEYVIYDREDIADYLLPIIAGIINNDDTAISWLTIRTILKQFSAFIKNPTFKDEREVRIIYYPDNVHGFDNATELEMYICDDYPHCSLPWIKSNGMCSLREIIVGTNCRYSCEDVKSMIKDLGISDVDVKESDYPYQVSNNR